MSNHKVIDAINNINDKYLEEAIGYQGKKRVKFKRLPILTVAAACLCLMVGVGAQQYDYRYVVDSVVDIDVNPSIELKVSKAERVLAVNALNADAKVVLEGMQLKNADLDTAMDAIVGSLLENGYLSEAYNAINVCVENQDEEAGAVLGQKLKDGITLLLDENELIGKVQMQTSSTDEEMEQGAEAYGVSVGKYALAKRVSENVGTKLEEAVALSIGELWDLSDAESVELITKEAALEIAYADAGVDAENAELVKNVIEKIGGKFIYRIEFLVGENGIYKYKIDAEEGTILAHTYEYREAEPEIPEELELLTRKEVLEIAYADAGVADADVRLHKIKLKKAEVVAFDVEFTAGNCDYWYLINALDGTIIDKDVEEVSCTVSGGDAEPQEPVKPEAIISEQDALQIVLDAVGVTQEEISKLSIRFKNNKISAEYRICFFVEEVKYEYLVNAVTGEIIDGKNGQENPEGKPELDADEIPGDVPENKPENKPGNKPENIPDSKPENIPDSKPENVPEGKPENVPEGKPEKEPENIPENKPENVPENKPENKPENVPENIPENKPGNVPENRPDKEPVQEPEAGDDGTIGDETIDGENVEEETPEVPGEPPMENPDGDMGRLPNENPNGQWENVPNPNPENEKPQNQDGQMNGPMEGEQIPRR